MVSVHASLHNHFNSERHLINRQTFKERRSAAWAEWQILDRPLGSARLSESGSHWTDSTPAINTGRKREILPVAGRVAANCVIDESSSDVAAFAVLRLVARQRLELQVAKLNGSTFGFEANATR